MVSADQCQVFQGPSDHCAEQVAGKGHVGRRGVTEGLCEDEVGEDDRRERKAGGDGIPEGRRVQKQLFRWEKPRKGERAEQANVERRGATDREPGADPDRDEHAQQDREEDERVDGPGRAEQEAERHEAARLEEEERDPQDEEVRAEPAAERHPRDT